MTRALAEYHVAGVRTTIPVLARIMRHPDFVAGRLDTGFMERLLPAEVCRPRRRRARRTIALAAAAIAAYDAAGRRAPSPPAAGPSAWTRSGRDWPRPR